MDDRIIDLGDYLREREESREPVRTTFALAGGEGERSRFALPLWRAAYLVGGSRAAMVWAPEGGPPEASKAFVVLDLGSDPPRLDVPEKLVSAVRDASEAPTFHHDPEEGAVIFLGQRDGRRWYLVVSPLEDGATEPPSRRVRDDLSFLAGECAGLLFHREMDREADREAGPS